jgi:hypothetical protein
VSLELRDRWIAQDSGVPKTPAKRTGLRVESRAIIAPTLRFGKEMILEGLRAIALQAHYQHSYPSDCGARLNLAQEVSSMHWKALLAFVVTILSATILDVQSKSQVNSALAGSKVVIIAPSVSTSMMARTILTELRLSETTLRHADRALVVVRSSLSDPLNSSYETECELKQDAENQLSIAGPNYHIYIYDLDDDLRAPEKSHKSFPADE